MWTQVYDPFGNIAISACVAALPLLVLLGSIAFLEIKAHVAALLGISSALLVAILGFGMPTTMALAAAAYGASFGLLPIGWIILNIIFLYTLTEENGDFARLQASIRDISDDKRIQLLFIAFSLGAFFEGAAGFGTPVAVTAAMLIGLGFSPLTASGLSLIANTAPVAFGALGTPVIALAAVTELDLQALSGMIGRQLPFFSLLVPFWLIWAFAGFRKMTEIWPAIAVAGVSFAIPQYIVSNFHGPWLVDIVSALLSMTSLALFLRFWQPQTPMTEMPDSHSAQETSNLKTKAGPTSVRVWIPWILLSVFVFLWGIPEIKKSLDTLYVRIYQVPGLHELIQKVPPVAPKLSLEKAEYKFNILSATGTGIFLSALLSALMLGYRLKDIVRIYLQTLYRTRFSLLTIACMLAIGYVSRYSGTDATLGLLLSNTGFLYPFFGTLIGWLGVALTGSDTASNVLFGGLQRVSAEQLGLNPILMAAANSSGGVMGKMIDAQSIVVASTATRWYGNEGAILRFVFFHSVALACLVGVLVMAQAYVTPFTKLVSHQAGETYAHF